MDTPELEEFSVWEDGLRGSTREVIEAPTQLKAMEAYAQKWALSISNVRAEKVQTWIS